MLSTSRASIFLLWRWAGWEWDPQDQRSRQKARVGTIGWTAARTSSLKRYLVAMQTSLDFQITRKSRQAKVAAVCGGPVREPEHVLRHIGRVQWSIWKLYQRDNWRSYHCEKSRGPGSSKHNKTKHPHLSSLPPSLILNWTTAQFFSPLNDKSQTLIFLFPKTSLTAPPEIHLSISLCSPFSLL